jgi:trigger factor
MQVSVETVSGLERRVKIAVPAAKVDSEVNDRINKAARTVRMDGFRPGKVPLAVVKKRFGPGIRQEAIGDIIRDSFYEAVTSQSLNPAGFPTIESLNDEAGKDFEFVATFEVYPEITLSGLDTIKVERPVAEVTDADLDTMILNLRRQRASWAVSNDAANDGDRLDIDFDGSVDGEAFEGGSAKAFSLTLGSKRMIPGFEDQLVGARAGEERVLKVTFPEDYQAENLRGKVAEFKVLVNKVEAPLLPELDAAFLTGFGVTEGGADRFRSDVRKNMERELRQALKNNVKTQALDGLLAANPVDVPKALVANEVQRARENMMKQFGGRNVDPSMLPDELFAEQAKRSVSLGLLVGEVIRSRELVVDAARVKSLIDEVAESYEDPSEVVNWYYSSKEQLQQVESVVLEDQVVDSLLASAQVTDKPATYEDVLRRPAQQR